MLHQIGELESFLVNITKDLGQSKRSMLAACQQLTNALKLSQEKVEQRMVGTALDETCSSTSEICRVEGRKRQKTALLSESK
ncbi:hypothetical protein V6Z11_A07G192300 [Gossypium hirsutum]